jgi:glycosyltransferase involved in cell wall biosynthesis
VNIDVYCYDDVDNPRCGGGGAYRELAVHKLIARRHSIRFHTGNFKGAKNFDEANFHYRHLGCGASYLLSRISFSLIATLRSLFSNADIIAIPYSIYSPVLTFLFKPEKTVVLFFHITGNEVFKKYGLFGLFPLLAEQLVLGTARLFITLTDGMAGELKRRRPGVFARAGYVSFDTSLLSQSGTDEKYILCFGRIDIRMKGLDVLVDAFEKIAGSYPDHRLVIAGRGKESDVVRLRQRIAASPFSGRIDCVTNVPDHEKKRLFHGATFVCMPSRFEGWNIAAIEAAASSKATLGTRIHGLTDAIKENETGLLAPPENAPALAEKMELLLKDDILRKKLGDNGYTWAQQFTFERVAAIQEEFYTSIYSGIYSGK